MRSGLLCCLPRGLSVSRQSLHLRTCSDETNPWRSNESHVGMLSSSGLCFQGGEPRRYVGGAPGKIDLYVGKEVVRRAIPMDDATNQLIELIKEHDR